MTPPGQSDSHLRCEVCGRRSTTSFASSMAHGWEKCHGYTMTLVRTEADIEVAVAQAAGPGARFAIERAVGERVGRRR